LSSSQKFARFLSIIASISVLAYVIFLNTVPFGRSEHLFQDNKNISGFSPANRLDIGEESVTIKDDLIYYKTQHNIKYEEGAVRIVFKNPGDSQEVWLGFRDQKDWHYSKELLDSPLLNSLNWKVVGNGPYLYQKRDNYSSIDDFLSNPPEKARVGTYAVETGILMNRDPAIPNYSPSDNAVEIQSPLRGNVTMYSYLRNESFDMTFSKRDLNWYPDPDVTKITVYRQNDKVFEATIDDDGNDTDNRIVGNEQKVTIKNPGPGLPEPGVYKIIVEQSGDSVMTNVSSMQNKLVFQGPLWIVANAEAYPGLVSKTEATNLYASSSAINARIYHNEAAQTVKDDFSTHTLNDLNEEYSMIFNDEGENLLSFPKSDIRVTSDGYFAFDKSSLFLPSPFKILPIIDKEDIDTVDFILTSYQGAPKRENGWLETVRKFNLNEAVPQDGKLGWIIQSPNLKLNNGALEIKSIEMILSKKGWLE
jgi:hypothetical protein